MNENRMPGVASVSDAARNLYGMYSMGFNLFNPDVMRAKGSKGFVHGVGLNGQLSVGGVMSAGGLAGVGAVAGAALGSQMEGNMILPAAGVGAAIGLAAIPAAGVVGRAGYEVGKGLLTKVVPKIPTVAEHLFRGAANVVSHAPVLNKIGAAGAGFASMMVDWDTMKNGVDLMNSVKLTNPITGAISGWKAGTNPLNKVGNAVGGSLINGQTAIWGSSIIAGAVGAFKEFNKIRMGRMDGMITTPAPRTPVYDSGNSNTPSYSNNAGATGDLVFALNANRKG